MPFTRSSFPSRRQAGKIQLPTAKRSLTGDKKVMTSSKLPQCRRNVTLPACTIASKINGTPKGDHLLISKLHSILAVANLLAHNKKKSQICYCGQISLQSAAVYCSFSDNLTPLGVPFTLLTMYIAIKYIIAK